MTKAIQLSAIKEALWWLLPLLAAVTATVPIFPFIIPFYLYFNAALVFALVFMFRIILFYRSITYLHALWIKIVLSFLLICYVPWMMVKLQDFYYQMDSFDFTIFLIDTAKADYAWDAQYSAFKYFRTSFLFVSIASMILAVVALLRIIGSLWWKKGK